MNRFRNYIFTSSIFSSIILFFLGVFLLFNINNAKSKAGSISSILGLDEYAPLTEPINVLLLGGDKSGGRTDTIMLVNYNPTNSQVSLLSIPRDTKITYNNRIDKINSVYINGGKDEAGCKTAVETVERLLQVNINYYVYITTSVFRDVIDELGGVKYYVPCDMYYKDSSQGLLIDLKKGEQILNGSQAEGIMRFRKSGNGHLTAEQKKYYDGSDLKRIDAQQNFLKTVIKEKASIASLSKIQNIMAIIFDELLTDIDMNTSLRIAANLGDLNTEKFKIFKIKVLDEYINNISYVKYVNKITDNTTKEDFPSEEILDLYFSTNSSRDWDKSEMIFENNSNNIENNSNTNNQTGEPTEQPVEITEQPTIFVTETRLPTESPKPEKTNIPTEEPTKEPTKPPTPAPTIEEPTEAPTITIPPTTEPPPSATPSDE